MANIYLPWRLNVFCGNALFLSSLHKNVFSSLRAKQHLMLLFSVSTAEIIINSTLFFNFSNPKINLQVPCGICCTKGL